LTDLPDANIWLALSVPDHPHHARAANYWHNEAHADRAFSRMTWLALPRLLSDRRIFGEAALGGSSAWQVLHEWTSRPEVTFLHEPPDLDALIGHWCDAIDLRGGDWTDAYLAAFAITSGCRLVSFDAAFAHFEGLTWLHLVP
jgi:uncharacterized protein